MCIVKIVKCINVFLIFLLKFIYSIDLLRWMIFKILKMEELVYVCVNLYFLKIYLMWFNFRSLVCF